jgi:hypothetical protein
MDGWLRREIHRWLSKRDEWLRKRDGWLRREIQRWLSKWDECQVRGGGGQVRRLVAD